MGRIKTSGIELRRRAMQISTVLRNYSYTSIKSAKAKNIDIDFNVIGDGILCADINLIGRVIHNLLSNVVKFSYEGKRIEVSVARKVSGWWFAVRDFGVGILPEESSNIFEFGHSKTKVGTSGEKGFGVGLPLCHEIIMAHGGKINVSSPEDQGSLFEVSIPDPTSLTLVVSERPPETCLSWEILEKLDVSLIYSPFGTMAEKVIKELTLSKVIVDLSVDDSTTKENLHALISKTKSCSKTIIAVATDKQSYLNNFDSGFDDIISLDHDPKLSQIAFS